MEVSGSVATPYTRVREVFADVLAGQPGTGASFAVWHDGEWVVDLWGGYADAGRTRPWRQDTLVMPYSVTKPFAALCVLTLADRGLVELVDDLAHENFLAGATGHHGRTLMWNASRSERRSKSERSSGLM